MKPIHLSLSTPPTENHSFHTFAHLLTGFLGYQSQDSVHHGVSLLILSRNKPPQPPLPPIPPKGWLTSSNLHNAHNHYQPGTSFMITRISAHFMPDTKVPGELSLTKIINPVSNLYHQAPKLKTATVIALILKTPLISDVIMVVGVTVAGVTVVTLTITITAEILTAHCVHTMYYHKEFLSLYTTLVYIYM